MLCWFDVGGSNNTEQLCPGLHAGWVVLRHVKYFIVFGVVLLDQISQAIVLSAAHGLGCVAICEIFHRVGLMLVDQISQAIVLRAARSLGGVAICEIFHCVWCCAGLILVVK